MITKHLFKITTNTNTFIASKAIIYLLSKVAFCMLLLISTKLYAQSGCSNGITINSITITDASCNLSTDGIIDIYASGGDNTLEYYIDGNPASETISGLGAGTYSIEINDGLFCSTLTTVTINEPDPINVNTSIITPITCSTTIAVVELQISGGIQPYNYASVSNQNLSQGLNTITVTDNNLCSVSTDVLIENYDPLVVAASITNTPLCFGEDLIISLSVSGGIPPYTYNGAPIQNTYTVPQGNGAFTVTDNIGCTGSTTYSFTPFQPVLTILESYNQPICKGGTGTINIAASGGTGNYSSIGTFNPSAGTHTYTAVDQNGCHASNTAEVILIDPPSNFNLNYNLLQPVCSNSNTAGISISGISGGTSLANLVVSINNVNYPINNSYYIFNTNDAPFNLKVTDISNGCADSTLVNFTFPPDIDASPISISSNSICPGESANIISSDNNLQIVAINNIAITATTNYVITPTITTNYTITVANQLNCTTNIQKSIIVKDAPVIANTVLNHVKCAGELFSITALVTPYSATVNWNNGTTSIDDVQLELIIPSSTFYTITATYDGCITQQIHTLTVNPLPTPSITANTSIFCANKSYTLKVTGSPNSTFYWGIGSFYDTINVLTTANTSYTVYELNSAGCGASATFSINLSPSPFLPNQTAIACSNAPWATSIPTATGTPISSIKIIGVNAPANVTQAFGSNINLATLPFAGYAYAVTESERWINQNTSAQNVVYTMRAIGSNGCESDDATFTTTIQPTQIITVESSTSNLVCQGQSTTITATSTPTLSTYTVSNAGNVVSPTTNTTYTVIGTSTDGCTHTATIAIQADNEPIRYNGQCYNNLEDAINATEGARPFTLDVYTTFTNTKEITLPINCIINSYSGLINTNKLINHGIINGNLTNNNTGLIGGSGTFNGNVINAGTLKPSAQ
jgi:hypothetical protein